jgi:DNA end-binding protein Ku
LPRILWRDRNTKEESRSHTGGSARGFLDVGRFHYAYEIRNAADYFDDIPDMKLPGEMIQLAEHILATKAGHFDPSEFEDRYENAVVEMLRRKQAGLAPAEQPEAAAPTNVVNLMDALRRSIEGEKPAARPKDAGRKKPARQPERRPAKAARKAG